MAKKLTHTEYLTLRNSILVLRASGAPLDSEQIRKIELWEVAVREYERENKQEYFCPGCGYAGVVAHESAPVFDVLYSIEDDHWKKRPSCRQPITRIRVRNVELCSDEEWAKITGGKAC